MIVVKKCAEYASAAAWLLVKMRLVAAVLTLFLVRIDCRGIDLSKDSQ